MDKDRIRFFFRGRRSSWSPTERKLKNLFQLETLDTDIFDADTPGDANQPAPETVSRCGRDGERDVKNLREHLRKWKVEAEGRWPISE